MKNMIVLLALSVSLGFVAQAEEQSDENACLGVHKKMMSLVVDDQFKANLIDRSNRVITDIELNVFHSHMGRSPEVWMGQFGDHATAMVTVTEIEKPDDDRFDHIPELKEGRPGKCTLMVMIGDDEGQQFVHDIRISEDNRLHLRRITSGEDLPDVMRIFMAQEQLPNPSYLGELEVAEEEQAAHDLYGALNLDETPIADAKLYVSHSKSLDGLTCTKRMHFMKKHQQSYQCDFDREKLDSGAFYRSLHLLEVPGLDEIDTYIHQKSLDVGDHVVRGGKRVLTCRQTYRVADDKVLKTSCDIDYSAFE